jgi:hypothetical protein
MKEIRGGGMKEIRGGGMKKEGRGGEIDGLDLSLVLLPIDG